MQLEPRYGNQAIITMDATFPHPGEALADQRVRQEGLFARFGAEHWSASTRCDAWNVRDVVAHLVSVTGFWAGSIRAGLAGEPTTMLGGFDPAVHPNLLLDGLAELDGPAVLERFRLANDDLVGLVVDLPAEAWSMTAESPVGHVAIDRVVEHALWDAWVHEHDIGIPHGMEHRGGPDELGAVLRFGAVAGPAMGNMGIDGFTGTLVVDATDLERPFTVEVSTSIAVLDRGAAPGTPTLRGPAAELIDALALRSPLPPDAPEEARALTRNLSAVFS